MSRLTGLLLGLLAVALVALPLWFSVRGAGVPKASPDDERAVRSTGARVFIGGGLRSGK